MRAWAGHWGDEFASDDWDSTRHAVEHWLPPDPQKTKPKSKGTSKGTNKGASKGTDKGKSKDKNKGKGKDKNDGDSDDDWGEWKGTVASASAGLKEAAKNMPPVQPPGQDAEPE